MVFADPNALQSSSENLSAFLKFDIFFSQPFTVDSSLESDLVTLNKMNKEMAITEPNADSFALENASSTFDTFGTFDNLGTSGIFVDTLPKDEMDTGIFPIDYDILFNTLNVTPPAVDPGLTTVDGNSVVMTEPIPDYKCSPSTAVSGAPVNNTSGLTQSTFMDSESFHTAVNGAPVNNTSGLTLSTFMDSASFHTAVNGAPVNNTSGLTLSTFMDSASFHTAVNDAPVNNTSCLTQSTFMDSESFHTAVNNAPVNNTSCLTQSTFMDSASFHTAALSVNPLQCFDPTLLITDNSHAMNINPHQMQFGQADDFTSTGISVDSIISGAVGLIPTSHFVANNVPYVDPTPHLEMDTFIAMAQMDFNNPYMKNMQVSQTYQPKIRQRLVSEMVVHGNMTNMLHSWTNNEIFSGRRLVQFSRKCETDIYGQVVRIHIGFNEMDPLNYKLQKIQENTIAIARASNSAAATNSFPATNSGAENPIVVSCIYWKEKNDFYITSVDCVLLLEKILGLVFSTEEKNRIRRNLEGFHPLTISKGKQEVAEFFKLVMGFPHPRPRNIEKDIKVFPWKNLPAVMNKVVRKYSTTFIFE